MHEKKKKPLEISQMCLYNYIESLWVVFCPFLGSLI